MILLAGWAIAILTVAFGYIIAGPIWVKRHSLRFRVGHTLRRCSGMYGEMALVTFGAVLVFMIDQSSPDVSVDEIVMANPVASLTLLALVAAVVYIHGIRTAMAAEIGEKRRLAFTYSIYGIFSTIFFAGGAALIALLVCQALADARHFAELSEAAIGQLPTGAGATGKSIQRGLELVEQLADGGIAVMAVGAWTYIGYYSSFIDDYIASLAQFRELVVQEGSDVLERYSEIYVQMISQKTLLGFVTRISNEWGGVAAVLGVTQWIVEQFNRPEQEESPAHAEKATEA